MKKHLFLIRHGVTNHIAQNIQQTDTSELSKHGHAQAAACAARFAARALPHDETGTHLRKDFYIDALFTSPYTRAVQTGEALARSTGLPLTTLDYVHERRVPSSLEGSAIHSAEREAIIEKIFKLWVAGKNERLADEETYDDILVRINKLKDFVLSHPGEHIAVVSHATFIKTFLSTVFHSDLQAPRAMWSLYHSHEVANTGISEFTYDDTEQEDRRWKLVTWNDRAHLFHIAK
jgi:broad specificity phosphatase PhoE